ETAAETQEATEERPDRRAVGCPWPPWRQTLALVGVCVNRIGTERTSIGEPIPISLAGIIAVVDERRACRIGALDADFAGRFLARQIGPEACGVLLLVDWKRMGLPLRLALSVGGTAHVRGEEASGRYAEPFRPEQHRKARMIGQVASNRKVRDNVDPKRAQPFGRANAGAMQDGRAVID